MIQAIANKCTCYRLYVYNYIGTAVTFPSVDTSFGSRKLYSIHLEIHFLQWLMGHLAIIVTCKYCFRYATRQDITCCTGSTGSVDPVAGKKLQTRIQEFDLSRRKQEAYCLTLSSL